MERRVLVTANWMAVAGAFFICDVGKFGINTETTKEVSLKKCKFLHRKLIFLTVVVMAQLLIGSTSLGILPFADQGQRAVAHTSSLVAYIERWDEPRGEWRHWGTLITSRSQLALELRGTESQNRSTATIVRYEWDFGDGHTAEGEYVSHMYTTGYYGITLTVYDKYGNSASETLAIEVRGSTPISLHTHFLAVMATRFDSIDDLDESKIVTPISPTYIEWLQTALSSYGISFSHLYIPTSERLLALRIGVVDAVLVTYHPCSYLEQSIASGEIRLLPWSVRAVEAVVATYPEATTGAELPANTYAGQTRTIFGYAPTLAFIAAEFAKSVIGGEYLWGGKGWDLNENRFVDPRTIKESGYYYWNPCKEEYYDPRVGKWKCVGGLDFDGGLDCSGLVYWSYNKAQYAARHAPYEGFVRIDGEVRFPDNPIAFENADNQFSQNVDSTVDEASLQPGDLLFFDTPWRAGTDHVAMYVGDYYYSGGTIGQNYYPAGIYDCVEARKDVHHTGIVPRTLTELKNDSYFKSFGRVIWVVMPWAEYERIVGRSPVNLEVSDPNGLTVGLHVRDVPGMVYLEFDINDDGEDDDIVLLLKRRMGDYVIDVVPASGASPEDSYTLEVFAANTLLILADNITITNIPAEGYMIRSTENTVTQIILVTLEFKPDTLNLESMGKLVTVYIELPMGYDVGQIDVSTIVLNGVVPALEKPIEVGDHDSDGVPDLMVKFDRSDVQDVLKPGGDEVKVMVSGELTDGTLFEGIDTIRTIT